MIKKWQQLSLFGIALFVINLLLTFLIGYLAGSLFDTIEFSEKVLKWREMGEYPFPDWLLYLIPRLAVWPIFSEITYQFIQMMIWAFNAYLITKYLRTLQPLKWIWLPFILHLSLYDPLQAILGSVAFYLVMRKRKYGISQLSDIRAKE